MPVEGGMGGLVFGPPRRREADTLPTRPRDRVSLRQGCHLVGLATLNGRAPDPQEVFQKIVGLLLAEISSYTQRPEGSRKRKYAVKTEQTGSWTHSAVVGHARTNAEVRDVSSSASHSRHATIALQGSASSLTSYVRGRSRKLTRPTSRVTSSHG